MDRVAAHEVVARLASPGFQILPPTLRHADLIPPEVARAMGWAWHQVWFPPREVRVCVLEHVFVAAEGLVLRENGAVMGETVQQHDVAQIGAAQIAAARAALGPCVRLGGTLILCRKPGAWNYGHWLVEMLPRAALAGFADGVLVQDVGGGLRAVMQDGLALLGVDWIVAAGTDPVWVERLVVVDGLSEHGSYVSPLALPALEQAASGVAAGDARWLFVIRPGARRLVDEDRIAAAAAVAGFTVVDPSTLGFAAQVALFKGARRVVGVMGAALANIVFAPPDAEIFVIAPATMPDTFFWFLAGLRGQRMLEIRCAAAGPSTGAEPWDAELWLETADLARILDPEPLSDRAEMPGFERLLHARFDAAAYRDGNPDVAASGIDPLRHFLETGWREGRNPSRDFDTREYLASHDAGGLNPLIHAILAQQGDR